MINKKREYSPPKSAAEKCEDVRQLIDWGRDRGYLAHEEVMGALPDIVPLPMARS